MSTVLIESDDGELASASAVLRVRATNAEYNQPALRIDQASKRGGAASIKIVDPNPDIELVESDVADAAHPASVRRSRVSASVRAVQGPIARGSHASLERWPVAPSVIEDPDSL